MSKSNWRMENGAVVTLVAMAVVFGLLGNSSTAQTKKKFDPEQIRREMAQKRKEMEQKRREMQRNRSTSSSLRSRSTTSRLTSPSPRSSVTKSASAPRYSFRPNQRFAYLVLLEWKEGSTVNRIMGMPFYHVKYQIGKKSTALVIGRFRHYIKSANDAEFRHRTSRDYWMPTIQIVGDRFVEGFGKEEVGELELPFLMPEFVTVSRLVFPPLPTVLDRRLGKTESAVISRTQYGATLWEGFRYNNGEAGRVARYSEAKSLGSSTKLDIDHSYVNQADDFSASYQSHATIDRQGLKQSHGTYVMKDSGRTTVVAISVRRLSGSDLETAQQSAIAELGNLPKSLLPVELARKPLDLKFPKSYSADTLPAPGTKVAYYDKTLSQRFEAVYLKKDSSGEAKIQLSGSGESRTVRPSALAMIK